MDYKKVLDNSLSDLEPLLKKSLLGKRLAQHLSSPQKAMIEKIDKEELDRFQNFRESAFNCLDRIILAANEDYQFQIKARSTEELQAPVYMLNKQKKSLIRQNDAVLPWVSCKRFIFLQLNMTVKHFWWALKRF